MRFSQSLRQKDRERGGGEEEQGNKIEKER